MGTRSFASLSWEEHTAGLHHEVTLRQRRYPNHGMIFGILIGLEVVFCTVLALYFSTTRRGGWGVTLPKYHFDLPLVFIGIGIITPYATLLAATAFAKLRAMQLSPIHPRMRRDVRISWTESDGYRDKVDGARTIELDGRPFSGGPLLAVAYTTSGSNPSRAVEIHLICRDAAIELTCARARFGVTPPAFAAKRETARAFAEKLAKRLGCEAKDGKDFSLNGGPAFAHFMLVLFLPALFLGAFGGAQAALQSASSFFALLGALIFHLVMVTWGARHLVQTVASEHAFLMARLGERE